MLGYSSTNVDNLLVLGTLAATRSNRHRVINGFVVASVVVFCLSVVFVALSYVVPPSLLAYLGIVPIAFGLRMLANSGPVDSDRLADLPGAGTVATALIANSSDTIAVFAPLFAESELHVVAALAAGFFIAAFAWLAVIVRLADRLVNAERLHRIALRLTPLIMIAVGIYIIMNTGTDLQ